MMVTRGSRHALHSTRLTVHSRRLTVHSSRLQSRRLGLSALLGLLLLGTAEQAAADLPPPPNTREVTRRVQIENLGDYAGAGKPPAPGETHWQVVAYPYPFTPGSSKVGAAKMDILGLATARRQRATLYALPIAADTKFPEEMELEAAEAHIAKLGGVPSGVALGHDFRVPASSPLKSVLEKLRIAELTSVRFRLVRAALEYQYDDDKVERVNCDPKGVCPPPSRGPKVELSLAQGLDSPAPDPLPVATGAVATAAPTAAAPTAAASPRAGDSEPRPTVPPNTPTTPAAPEEPKAPEKAVDSKLIWGALFGAVALLMLLNVLWRRRGANGDNPEVEMIGANLDDREEPSDVDSEVPEADDPDDSADAADSAVDSEAPPSEGPPPSSK